VPVDRPHREAGALRRALHRLAFLDRRDERALASIPERLPAERNGRTNL
jgi:hypothetical protein